MDAANRSIWLSAVSDEYKALRAEGTMLMQQQYLLAYWSVSALVLLLVALSSSWDKVKELPLAPALAFLVVMPTLLMGFALSWSHVITGMARVGAHLFLLERKVAALIVGGGQFLQLADEHPERIPFAWEHVLWKRGSQAQIERTVEVVLIGVASLLLILWVVGARILGEFVFLNISHADLARTAIAAGTLALWVASWAMLRRTLKSQLRLATDEMQSYQELSGPLARTE